MGWLGKKKLFELHGWLGLTMGFFLFVICFSGSLAVLSPEMDWLADPQMRVASPEAGTAPLPWGELMASVQKRYPGGAITAFYKGFGPGSAYQASVRFAPADQRLVFVNPYTGSIQGQSTPFNIKSFFRIFHKQLYILRGEYWPHGRVFVCAFSIALLMSVGTALLFFKGWWRSLFRLRFGLGPRVLWSDLHRLAGVWSFLFAVLFGVTGLWYLTVQLREDFGLAEHESLASIPAEMMASRPPELQPLPWDVLIAKALAAYPEFEITGIFPNTGPRDGITLIGNGPAVLAEGMSNQIHIDPYSGEILLVSKAHELGVGERLAAMVDPLHFGRFGGFLTKAIWTAAGLALSAGILAGAGIWWLRAGRGSARFFRRSRFWVVATLLLNLGLITLAAVSTAAFIGNQVRGPLNPQAAFPLGTATLGCWEVEAFLEGERESPRSFIRFHFLNEADPNYKAAYAWTGQSQRPEDLKPLRGTNHSLYLRDRGATQQARDGARLQLELQQWDGKILAASFPLHPSPGALAVQFSPEETPVIPWGVIIVPGLFLFLLLIPAIFWIGWVR